jgi:molybdate transport system substrate-binding protein
MFGNPYQGTWRGQKTYARLSPTLPWAETPLGIVYSTDALAEPRVRIAGTFPDDTHPPIVYPIALTKDAKPFAREFLGYLSQKEARAVFLKDGFEVLVASH